MKPIKSLSYFLCIAMLFAISSFVSAQVFNGDLTLRTQAEVDVFHYTEVTGTLSIDADYIDDNEDNITNLLQAKTLFLWKEKRV